MYTVVLLSRWPSDGSYQNCTYSTQYTTNDLNEALLAADDYNNHYGDLIGFEKEVLIRVNKPNTQYLRSA